MVSLYKRKVGISIILSFLTFGVYYFFWKYMLVKNVRSVMRDKSSCTLEVFCFLFVPFYPLYWWYTRSNSVKEEFAKGKYTVSGNGILYAILCLFGLEIVSMAIMQSDFNSLPASESIDIPRTKRNTALIALGAAMVFLAIALIAVSSGAVSGDIKGRYVLVDASGTDSEMFKATCGEVTLVINDDNTGSLSMLGQETDVAVNTADSKISFDGGKNYTGYVMKDGKLFVENNGYRAVFKKK